MKRLAFIALGVLIILLSLSSSAAALPPLCQVNAPYLGDVLRFDEAAVFWLGHVAPNDNYADVRVAYVNSALWVHVNIMDQHLWYDTSPTADTLTGWDAVTVYLDQRGNTGSTPTGDSYRFDGQLNWWEPRDNWEAAYRGNGTGWVSIPVTFTTYNNWYGDAPPNVTDSHHGWFVAFSIPFSALGLSGPPPAGTVWGLGIQVHDRDVAAGPMQPDESWPDTMSVDQPSTWGRLRFGVPTYALPRPIATEGTTIVRQGLNGSVVQDAVVGGNTLCGGTLSDYFVQWGNLNYAHVPVYNVQNVEQISEWPCFSKVLATFPLTSLPAGKEVISATMTLHHSGNPGPAPESAYIQVLTVDQDWQENVITWNNAPRARENVGGLWISPLQQAAPYPGIPYIWDVSRAAAEAYEAGEPLRLAVYSASSPFHNGRYFFSSDVEDLNAVGRPTLTVAWGASTASLSASVQPAGANAGQLVTFTISLLGSGRAMTLTNDLPAALSAPIAPPSSTDGTIAYDAPSHRVIWHGTVPAGTPASLTYRVSVLTTARQVIRNRVVLTDVASEPVSSTAVLIANGVQVYLPITRK